MKLPETQMKDAGLLALRVLSGGMMALGHGLPKLMEFGAKSAHFPDPLGIGSTLSLSAAIFAELVCGILIVVGFKTRWAAIPLMFTMLVAAFVIHGDDPWNKKEFALVYAIPFLTLALTGGGKYSLDAFLKGRKA